MQGPESECQAELGSWLRIPGLGSSLAIICYWCQSNTRSIANLMLGPILLVSVQAYNKTNWCMLMKGLKKVPCTWNCKWKVTYPQEYCICIWVVVHWSPKWKPAFKQVILSLAVGFMGPVTSLQNFFRSTMLNIDFSHMKPRGSFWRFSFFFFGEQAWGLV